MINLDVIAEELFNKIRGRFSKVTIGDENTTIVDEPKMARFFDFDFAKGKSVNVSLDEDSLTVIYSNKLFDESDKSSKDDWYSFLKELRVFAKKRMLKFDTRDINKSNLDKRDYAHLSNTRPAESTMSESKMYGTSRTSFQDIGTARMVVKHTGPVNQELAAGRTQQIHSIYVESSEGERFKYPYNHLNGARALARHVSEGGNLYDNFGSYIVSLSEELNKLRKFKTYMNRSSVMAEGLAGYMDVVNERIDSVKKTVESIQKQSAYKEAFESFDGTSTLEEVPEDIQTDWIDQLTIKQFNEELKGVFPYIYKLVSEANAVKELGPEDLLGEGFDPEEFEGEFEYDAVGDDGEEDPATVEYKAKVVDGKPVVDPKSIVVYASGSNPSSKLGNDPDGDTAMQDMDELLQIAQEDADEQWAQRDNKYAQGESNYEQEINSRFNQEMGQFSPTEEPVEDEASKPDYIDIDKDGDKEEPMKKAVKDKKEKKTPLGEFILSYFDRETGKFPKGETAVLTMVEKDYGDEFIEPAQKFIEMIHGKVAEVMAYRESSKDLDNMKDLVKGIFKNPLKGDKEAKKANKKYGRDLAGRDIEGKEDLERIRNLAGL